MTGRRTLTVVVAVSAAILAPAATAALAMTAAKDPKTLALRKSDFPPGAVQFPVPDSTVKGPLTSFYSVTFNFRTLSREEEVTGYVGVSSSSGETAAQYRIHVAVNSGLEGTTVLKLPRYGDEQYAAFIQGPKTGGYSRARGELVVRKGKVVWDLTVESCGPFAPYGCTAGRTPPNLTRAQAIAELKKYAAKQKARVGKG
jgi:hypothetical protein